MESMKNKLEQDMLRLLESGEIVFQCQGEKIKAHRNILSARSPVFRAMFESGVGEEEKAEISVEDTEPAILKQLLCYIYTGKVGRDVTDYMKLMVLAKKYEVVELVEFASNELLQGLGKDNALELGIFGEIHSSPVHLNSSAKFILDNIDDRWSLPEGWEPEMIKHPQLMKAIIEPLFDSGRKEKIVVDNVESLKLKLEQDMLNLLESGDNSDIVFHCKGEEITAHRKILSARSPVFRAMMELDQPAEISVEDTEPDILRQLLKYLYVGKVEQNFSDYEKLIVLANKYEVVELLDYISLKLLGTLNQENAVELAIFGEIHNLTALLNGSANFFLKTKSIPDVLKQEMTKYPKLMLAIIRAVRQKREQARELVNVTKGEFKGRDRTEFKGRNRREMIRRPCWMGPCYDYDSDSTW